MGLGKREVVLTRGDNPPAPELVSLEGYQKKKKKNQKKRNNTPTKTKKKKKEVCLGGKRFAKEKEIRVKAPEQTRMQKRAEETHSLADTPGTSLERREKSNGGEADR